MIGVKYCRRNVLRIFLMTILVSLLIFYNHTGIINLSQHLLVPKTHCSSLTPLCQIMLDPWDPSMKKFFKKLTPTNCSTAAEDMLVYQTEDGFLRIDEAHKKNLMSRHKTQNSSLTCTKQEVYRDKWEENERKSFRLKENMTQFTEETPMDVEFAEIKCYIGNTTVYHNYFFNVIRKLEVEAECQTNKELFLAKHAKCHAETQLSVIIIGIDSLSKSNLLRQLPLTVDFVVNNLSGIEMSGYNKVGLNTFPCLTPYLTGHSTDELQSSCAGKQNRDKFDNCTFLWDIFAKAGYRTAYVDNYDEYNLFLYNGEGFHRQIAHYYSHTLYVPVNKKGILKSGCWRGKADDATVVDWALMFQKQFAHNLHYGHFWASTFSHTYDINSAQFLDPIYFSAFKKMNEENLLAKTLLIFMSDHGSRFGSYRETETGRKEENLPFMYFVFPQWFRDQQPVAIANLMENSNRLITTFDLHETIKSVIHCDYPYLAFCLQDIPPKKRGISLFMSISENRTCAEAGVPEIYCACKKNITQMKPRSSETKDLAKLLIDHINGYTKYLRNVCAEFHLVTVLKAKHIRELAFDVNDKNAVIDSYVISVLVKPGGAKFEGTIHFIPQYMSHVVEHDVQRINKYGNSSYCVSGNAFLKTICFCV